MIISALLSILGIFITIFFVIGIHELAHFVTARALGVKVLRFSIGFGKVLFKWHDQRQTEYVISLVPLGGYVKMLDESEEAVPVEQLPFAFNRQPFYKKFLIVLAGPLSNLLSAVILYWLIFVIGFFTIKPIIGNVLPQTIAATSGLTAQQEIITVDGKKTLSWTSVLFRVLMHIGDKDSLYLTAKDPKTNVVHHYQLNLDNWKLDEYAPDPLASLGLVPFEPEIPLIIGKIKQASPAAKQLKLGDKIIAVNQKPATNWVDLMTFIDKSPNTTFLLTIVRDGKTLQLPIKTSFKRDILLKQHGYLGIGPDFEIPTTLLRKIQYRPDQAFLHAVQEVWDFSYFNLLLLGKMITGKLSFHSLGGPITIFESAGSALNYGFIPFLGFLAFLSISIGIINFLPIPGLDGGHLFFQVIELFRQRPISDRWMLLFYRLGFTIIFLVLIQAIVNDVLRLT